MKFLKKDITGDYLDSIRLAPWYMRSCNTLGYRCVNMNCIKNVHEDYVGKLDCDFGEDGYRVNSEFSYEIPISTNGVVFCFVL